MHDDIGATISSINIMANMARNSTLGRQKREQYLTTIQEESKYVADSLSDIVWSINPKNDSPDIVFARMQRYASELLEAKNIYLEMKLPEHTDAHKALGMGKRQDLYLIFKEAINNLAKYAEAQNASVVIDIFKGHLTMKISDDGKGFNKHKLKHGNGILNMKKRAANMNGTIDIESSIGIGTTVTLSIPLN